ncbi:MAG: dihydropteroate synthase [Halieaceae bacterium]|jgi:dihydropteroate synthase|nr:dihydropteroate synthase [Halieaceae bacterium]
MGVLNITPDSFSDGGRLYAGKRVDMQAVCATADAMVASGAAVLDVGGESTRPGATPVSEQEELDRVLPVIEALRARCDALVSVDTSTPIVIREAAAAGADLINDVRALTRPGALEAAAATGLPVCLMHMQGTPATMQEAPSYLDVVTDVAAFLEARMEACRGAGIERRRILLDPGFGFGKTVDHNLELLRRLPELAALGPPLLVGLSRKSLIGKLTGRDVADRLPGSLALALLAAQRGARLLRVHDVAETVDVLRILEAVDKEGRS